MQLIHPNKDLQKLLEEIVRDPNVLDYTPLYDIAKEMFTQYSDFNFTEICGPISTGPIGTTRETRLDDLHTAIQHLHGTTREDGTTRYIFDQTVFEIGIESIKQRRSLDCYDLAIHEQFYDQLFQKVPNLNELIFLPDYEYSIWANAEHHSGLMLADKMKIKYLLPDWKNLFDSDKKFCETREERLTKRL